LKPGLGFPGQVGAVLVASVIVLAYPLWQMDSREIVTAVATGAVMATVNALAGYRALRYAQGKSYTKFLKVVLGGTGIRMAVLLGALVALIKLAGMHPVALTVSLLGYYAVFLVLEILAIQRNVLPPNQG
jgi:hypothetical protein